MAIYGYIRVSTKEQNTDRQFQAMAEYAVANNITIDRTFEEKASGKDFKREVYQNMKLALRPCDTLIIKELDRLGRDMEQIKDEWGELQKMGVDIIVIDNNMLNTANKTDLERKLISNVLFELLSYMAEKERIKIKSRQAEGIAAAQARGVQFGRPTLSVPDDFGKLVKKWRKKQISLDEVLRLCEMSKSTFYRRLREYRLMS
ncbi:MAG: recombinase family protein [Treponema sp.]|nr:recombinase family protein [Treponema sp.]